MHAAKAMCDREQESHACLRLWEDVLLVVFSIDWRSMDASSCAWDSIPVGDLAAGSGSPKLFDALGKVGLVAQLLPHVFM